MDSESEIISIFKQVEDPKSHINQLYNLIDILLIGMISVICEAEMRSTSRIQKIK